MKSNNDIAEMLNEMSEILELKGELSFKIVAYRRAVQGVHDYPTSVELLHNTNGVKGLQTIEGVGEGISEKIEEYIKYGRVSELDRLRKKYPKAEVRFMKIPGVGAATAKILYKKFGDLSFDTLKQKLSRADHGGLSVKTAERIVKGIEILSNLGDRMLISEAIKVADRLTHYLEAKCGAIDPIAVGSLRRRKETIGDIDIICASSDPSKTIDCFKKFGFKKIINQGRTKFTAILPNDKEMDLEILPQDKYGSLLLHFTGSKEHNVRLRTLAQTKGLSLSEHGLKKDSGQTMEFLTEPEVYKALGLKYIEPELREDRGEIEAAEQDALPDLIELKDIRGDIHIHSTWSDGVSSIAEIAKAAKKKGYRYIGIADHLERFNDIAAIKKRLAEIDKVAESECLHIYNACEVSIKKDGRVEHSDEILKEFDYVIGSIHSNFDLDEQSMTKRMLKAIENPYIKIIGHPSARQINRRPSINVDFERVFKACRDNKVLLEINSSPYRLDLMDYLVFQARKKDLKFVISSDAHAASELELAKYGIMVARRGWCEKSDIINTLDIKNIEKIILKESL